MVSDDLMSSRHQYDFLIFVLRCTRWEEMSAGYICLVVNDDEADRSRDPLFRKYPLPPTLSLRSHPLEQIRRVCR